MLSEHRIRRTVEFSETDASGLVHFSNFFRYMEACEHAMYRWLGLSVEMVINGVRYFLPRAHADCTFVSPLEFEDEFEVQLLIREIRSKALINDYVLTKLNGPQRQCVAYGSITIVFTVRDEDGTLRATNIPRQLTDRLQPAPPARLAKIKRDRSDY